MFISGISLFAYIKVDQKIPTSETIRRESRQGTRMLASAVASQRGKLCLTLAALFCLFMPPAWPAPAETPPSRDSVRVQLKWHHQFQFAGYYAAQSQGYYAAEKLDVTIIEGGANRPPIREVLAGRAEFGVSDADLIKAYLEGKPLVALAAIFQHSPYILLTRADRGIRTISDLRGQRIMVSDEQGMAQIKGMLRREGLSLTDFQILPHQWDNNLLIEGQVDAISAYSTVEPFQLRARGVEPAMIRATDYGIDFYGDTLFTTRRLVNDAPDQVAAFRRASLRGWEYAMAHPDEMVELILRLPGVRERGITREMLRYEADAMRPLLGFVEPGHMNPGRWQAIGRTYAEVGSVSHPPTEAQLRKFIYNPRGAAPETWIKPLVVSLAILIFVGGWVLLWNIHLRRAVARRTAQLQRAEQELVYHVGNSPLGVVVWDAEFRVTRWTGQAEQLFGWTAAEVLGKCPTEWRFIHEEDRALTDDVMARLLSAREKRNVIRNRNYRKDGSVIDCEWYNSASLDHQGRIQSVFSLVLDVTARTRAEAGLRESEERFRLFMDNSPTISWVKDESGRYVYMSRTYEQRFGVRLSDCKGRTDAELWPAETAARLREMDLKVLAADHPLEVTEETTEPDGSTSYWLNTKFPFSNPAGQRFVASVGLDITPRIKAEEALRQSEARFRAVFEQAAIGMGRVGFNDAKWIDANEAFCRMLGYTREEMTAMSWVQMTHPDDIDQDHKQFNQMARGELQEYAVEKRFLHKDGHPVWARLTLSLVRDRLGRPDYEIAIIEDITERKEAEQKLRASEERLRRAVSARTVGVLFFNLDGRIHDANETFQGMSGYTTEELRTFHWKRLTAPEAWDTTLRAAGEMASRGETPPYEKQMVRKDGSRWWGLFAPVRLSGSGSNSECMEFIVDITDRKLTELALGRERAFVEAVLKACPAGIIAAEPDGRIVRMNPANERLWGPAPFSESVDHYGEWKGWWADGSPRQGHRLQPHEWALARSLRGEVCPGDIVEIEPFGQPGVRRVMINSGAPIRSESGEILGAVIVQVDITERKQVEEALRTSEEQLRVALGAGRMGTWVLDLRSGRVQTDALHRLLWDLEDAPAEVPASVVLARVHPEDSHVLIPSEGLARVSGSFDVEFRIIKRNGEVAWLHGSAAPLRNAQGEVTKVIGVNLDVTSQKRAEEGLRRSEQHFRALAESMPQLVWRTRANGDVEYVNERWLTYTGQTPEEAYGTGWSRALHPEDKQRTMAGWETAAATGNIYQMEHRLRNREGRYRWFLARAIPLRDAQGRIHNWFGTSTDIDDQRRILAALTESERRLAQARDELAVANAELGRKVRERTAELSETVAELEQMSYSMIHDLRAPLRAIQSFGSIIAEDPQNHLTEESRDLIRRMQSATSRMDHLVRDVLSYGSVLRQDLPLVPVDVGALARGIVETYPNLRLARVRIEPDLPLIQANPAAMTQCLSQIMGNAVKFARPGERADIQVRAEQAGNDFARIVVEDKGVGISADIRERVFGMFQQVRNTGEGTGMGLAIVRKAVERMGGRVGVDSEPGQGSRFWIELRTANELQAHGSVLANRTGQSSSKNE